MKELKIESTSNHGVCSSRPGCSATSWQRQAKDVKSFIICVHSINTMMRAGLIQKLGVLGAASVAEGTGA
jgi:hypothetical protein